MKNLIILPGLLLICSTISAQPERPDRSDKVPEKKQYTLSGFRHGVNYFPLVRLPGVEYEAGDTLSFDRYHSLDVIYAWLKKWEKQYPGLVELYEVGKSFEGRQILQMTLTNRMTGKDTDKPAAFFEGGRHSGEVTGSECVMWMADYLLTNYGIDPDVTRLLDTRTIYLKPVNNPDGHNLYMNTAQSNRSTVRPVDNDRDGLLDEDPPEDLDNDGMILTMRWKDEKKGNLIPDPADSSGRIMKRVPAGEGIYRSSSEGIDNDGDGEINEDGIGGLDLHRNYLENWRPMTEMTGRGYTQNGAGEFPLSETETRAVVSFLLAHPNVYVVNSMDTSVPMHLRPPSTSPSDARMYPEDLEWYKIFDNIGRKITGYKKAGDVYDDYGNGSPLFGHGPDFGYWYFGAIWYGDEIWNGARFKDYNNDGDTNQIDMLIWDDQVNNGEGFHEWKAAKHPVYGDIEIGGFDPKFFLQNPPAAQLEVWIRNEAMFNLEMAKSLPLLEWGTTEVKRFKAWKADSADYQLKITVLNKGRLPTALKQADLVKIVREDRIELQFDTAGIGKGKPSWKVIGEKKNVTPGSGRRMGMFDDSESPARQSATTRNIPYTQGGSSTVAAFTIRLYNRQELKGRASMYSTRGGILKDKEFDIK